MELSLLFSGLLPAHSLSSSCLCQRGPIFAGWKCRRILDGSSLCHIYGVLVWFLLLPSVILFFPKQVGVIDCMPAWLLGFSLLAHCSEVKSSISLVWLTGVIVRFNGLSRDIEICDRILPVCYHIQKREYCPFVLWVSNEIPFRGRLLMVTLGM